ncbi:MFS transporter [Spirillospora sp. NPDC047279]|uniref:MFS transporter n=1 Tax=Spirillospora sp. NPDC047279 TaxID=3155478 RepID=UPI00340829D6
MTDLLPRVRRGPMLAVLLTGQAMAAMDGSIVSVAAQTIHEDLNAGGAAIQLIVSGYLLTTGVLLVTCARLGDVLGHRRVFLAGLAWFTLASALCGLAPTAATLVVARIAQAAGAALLIPQVFSLIQLHWDGAARHRAIGLYSMVLALGVALGQVVGGLAVGVSWRSAFLINLPVGALLLAIGTRVLPAAASDVRRPRLDLVGVAGLTAAMTTLIVPLIFLPPYAWAWLVLGVVLLAAFVRYEVNAPHPVLDMAALRPAGVKPGLAACWIVMGCYTVFLLTLTLHLQSGLGFSPIEAGLAFVPYALGFGALSLTWNRYHPRVQRLLPPAGPLAFAVCAATLVLTQHDGWRPFGAVPLLMVAGAGHAAGYSPLIARITTMVDTRLASAISALNTTGPLLASVTAVAGLGSVYFAAPTSADGLVRVVAALAVLLALGSACAARVVLRRPPRPTA